MGIWFGVLPEDGKPSHASNWESCHMGRDDFNNASNALRKLKLVTEASILADVTRNEALASYLKVIPRKAVMKVMDFIESAIDIVEKSDLAENERLETESTLKTFRTYAAIALRTGRPLAIKF